ncbi:hypothetical protein Trydic_g11497 [Trypoxylus dichotomus]
MVRGMEVGDVLLKLRDITDNGELKVVFMVEIVIAIGLREIALTSFLDIEGVFDRALRIERALQRPGVEPTLTMLNNRTVHVSMNLCDIRVTEATGCPGGFYAQGCADDIAIMVSGRFEGVVFERMQVALRLVETWCRKESDYGAVHLEEETSQTPVSVDFRLKSNVINRG